MDLSIIPVKTSKDEITQPHLATENVIPRLGSSIIICGASGSGKSTLLFNLVVDKRFFGGNKYFKHIFLFSPTAECDDIQKQLDIPPACVCIDLDIAPLIIDKIYKHQMNNIKKKGNDKADQICIIMDDCIGNTQFMKHKAVIRSFIASRHFNCTTLICAQHFKKIEKVNRLQASFLFFFPMSQASLEVLCDEYCPANMNRTQFFHMVIDSLSEKFSFLTINMRVPDSERFRINLDRIINLEYYKQLQP